jgi:TonB family protein
MKTLPISIFVLFLCLVSLPADAAVRIEAVYEEKLHRIVDVRRTNPIIEVDGKRHTLSRSKFRINRNGGNPFEGGSFEIKDKQTRSRSLKSFQTGDQFNTSLYFRAQIKTTADIKNCFIAIELTPENGKSGFLLAELPNLKAGKWTKIDFDVPTYKALGGGRAKHYLFTNGFQVLPDRQFNQQLQRQARVAARGPKEVDGPPQIITPYNPGFPKELIGVISKGTVRMEYIIGKEGRARNVKVLESTHELLEQPAINAIMKTEYQAGIKEGKPVATRLRQTIEFNAPKKAKS